MKYTDTSKILSLVFHTLLFLAFGALGIYFGVFVVPGFFSGNSIYAEFSDDLQITRSFVLYLELAVIGLSIAAVAVKGALDAYKSLTKKTDTDLVNSFGAFIAEGWLAAIFFVLNASLFSKLLAGDTNVWFVVVMCLVFAIGVLIAVNIPTVKLFDGKDSKPLTKNISFAGIAAGGALFLVSAASTIFANEKIIMEARYPYVMAQLAVIVLIGAVILAASIVCFLSVEKQNKASVIAVSTACFALGVILIVLAIFNFSWASDSRAVCLLKSDASHPTSPWPSYSTVFNILVIALGVILASLGVAPLALPKKKAK